MSEPDPSTMTDAELRARVKPAPDETGKVVVDGLALAYEIHGNDAEKPVAVMLPGVGFPRVYFRPLAALLAPWVRSVLLDVRGAGDSDAPKDEAGYDLEGQAGDVVALLDHLGVKSAWIVGHSLGSNIALACAARFPARVDGAVVVSAALSADLVADHLREVWETADPSLRAICERYEKEGPVFVGSGPPEEYGVASSKIYQRHVVRGTVDTDVLWSMRQAIGPAGALWGKDSAFRITGLFAKLDQREVPAKLTRPLVAVAGRDDAYAQTSLPFIERAPRGRVVRMPDSLHHAHVEEPPRVAEIVLDAMFDRAPGAPALRLDVTVEQEADGGDDVRVADDVTGYRFALPAAAAPVLAALADPRARAPVDVAVAGLRALFGSGGDAPGDDELRASVVELVAQLDALGLLRPFAGPRARSDIELLQKKSRARERVQERFADAAAAVERAWRLVPLHRKRLEEAGVSPDDLVEPADLLRVPPMDKAVIRAHFPDGVAAGGVDVQKLLADGALTIGATSGTSDERLQVLFDWSRGGLPERARELWDLSEDQPLAKGAVFTTPLCAGFECHLGTTPPEARTRGTTLTLDSTEDLFSLSDDVVRRVCGEMRDHAPDVLFLHPWYGAWLAGRAAALGEALHRPTVVLTSYQLLTRRHRRLLADAFGAPVYAYWGATDLGGPLLGVECHCGRVHVREDHVYLEVDDADARGRGTLLVTVLGEPVMPLVRYRIGDVVRLHDDPCPCALGGEWQTLELLGRARDAITSARGTVLHTKDVDDALGDDGPDFWKLTQTGDAAYTLEVIGGAAPASIERVSALLEAKPKVIAVKRFSPERSLKFRQTLRQGAR